MIPNVKYGLVARDAFSISRPTHLSAFHSRSSRHIGYFNMYLLLHHEYLVAFEFYLNIKDMFIYLIYLTLSEIILLSISIPIVKLL